MSNPNQLPPRKTSTELAAVLIESDAISMDLTARQAERDGASVEVLAEYRAVRDRLYAAAAWLKWHSGPIDRRAEQLLTGQEP